MRFAVQQWIDAASPSNFLALNPEAQKKALETKGESIAAGHAAPAGTTCSRAMCRRPTRACSRSAATSPPPRARWCSRTSCSSCIEYKPLTAKVHERPMLFVPPCINKFYILDLQPENSLIRYTVEQGHRVFVVSWRNPDESMVAQRPGTTTSRTARSRRSAWCRRSAARSTINTLGFCVGGTILATALAVLAARGEQPAAVGDAADHACSTSPTPACSTSSSTKPSVQMREMTIGDQAPAARAAQGPGAGLDLQLPAAERPGVELRRRQLPQGRDAAAVRPAVLEQRLAPTCRGRCTAGTCATPTCENELKMPGKLTVCGEKVDLGTIEAPVYIYGSREDHIVPWAGGLRVDPAAEGQEALRAGRLGPHRRRDQPAGQEQAQPLDQRQAARPTRRALARPARPSSRAAGGPTGPAG